MGKLKRDKKSSLNEIYFKLDLFKNEKIKNANRNVR